MISPYFSLSLYKYFSTLFLVSVRLAVLFNRRKKARLTRKFIYIVQVYCGIKIKCVAFIFGLLKNFFSNMVFREQKFTMCFKGCNTGDVLYNTVYIYIIVLLKGHKNKMNTVPSMKNNLWKNIFSFDILEIPQIIYRSTQKNPFTFSFLEGN